MEFIWRVLTGCGWRESLTELRLYYQSHRQRLKVILLISFAAILLISALNAMFPRLHAIPLPSMQWWENHYGRYLAFGFLVYPLVASIAFFLPATADFPVDINRVTLLPRKLVMLQLSLPWALCYAANIHGFWWIGNDIAAIPEIAGMFLLFMMAILIPVGVLASLLNGFRIKPRFLIACVIWVVSVVSISVFEVHRFPLDRGNLSAFISTALAGWIALISAIVLLLWHRTRVFVFVLSNILLIPLYLCNYQVYNVANTITGWKAVLGFIYVVTWFTAGATGVYPSNWTEIVGVIK